HTHIPASLFGVPFPSLGALTQRLDDVTGGMWTPQTVKRDTSDVTKRQSTRYDPSFRVDWRATQELLRSEVSVISCSSCRGLEGVSLEYSVDKTTAECVLTKYHTRLDIYGDTLLNIHDKGCDILTGESFDAPTSPEGMEWNTRGIKSLTRVWGKVYIEIPLLRPSPKSRRGQYTSFDLLHSFVIWELSLDTLEWREVRKFPESASLTLLSLEDNLHILDTSMDSPEDYKDPQQIGDSNLYHIIYSPETDTWTDGAMVTNHNHILTTSIFK
ncbi:hypothetical protein KIPB_004613, partial [Kipferlia bialata]